MGREIVYCEGCGISLRTDDFEKGRAHEENCRPWCVNCKPLPNPPALKKSSTSRIPVVRVDPPRPSSGNAPRIATVRRSGPSGPSPALIGGIAGVALVLVAAVVALSGHRSAPPAPPTPPPAPEPARPAAVRPAPPRPAPAAREEEVVPKADPAAQLDTYLAQLRELVAKDTRFARRRDALSQIAATRAVAGARAGEVDRLAADYDRAFEAAAAKSVAGLRAEMERLAAAGDVAAASAKADEIPAPFADTAPARELRSLRESILKKGEDAARSAVQAKEAAIREWKPAVAGAHFNVMAEYRGRGPALETHPIAGDKPLGIERDFDLPAGKRAVLRFQVAPNSRGDWELRAYVDGQERLKQAVSPPNSDWKEISIDLSASAGKRVKVRLENAATGWAHEHGYWADFELKID